MFKIMTFFFVAITLDGEEITRVGPFIDGGTCVGYQQTIDNDISNAFSGPARYGQSADKWGVGGGAIFRYSNYDLPCVSVTFDTETNEIIREVYIN